MTEMARPTGEPLDSKSKDRSSEWKYEFENSKKLIKLISKVKPKMLLYKYGNTFVLTNEGSDYIAHIDTHKIEVQYNKMKKTALSITDGNSNIRGRYIVLLLSVLENINIDFIFSDIMLSDGAIKFYKKVLKGGPYNTFVLQYNEVKPSDMNKDYFNNSSHQIGISKLDNHIAKITEELKTIRKNNFKVNETKTEYNEIALLYGINELDEF
jgi:hypothetical protein